MILTDLLKSFKKNKLNKAGLVGLSMSEKHVTLASITHHASSGTPNLQCCEKFEVENQEETTSVLQNKVAELGLQETLCNYVLSPADYKLLLIEAPKVNRDEMEAAVKWQIKDLIDIPIEELVLSVFDIPENAYRTQGKMLYVVASTRAKILKIIDTVEASGLKLEAIDIPELSMQNLASVYSDDDNGLAFIELLATGSTINMSKHNNIYLTRRLNTPVDHNVMDTNNWVIIRDKLVLEIQRSLDYYESQMGQRPISKLVIAPRQIDSLPMMTELNEAMSIQVEVMDLNTKLNSTNELPLALQQECMLAIGGALRQQQASL